VIGSKRKHITCVKFSSWDLYLSGESLMERPQLFHMHHATVILLYVYAFFWHRVSGLFILGVFGFAHASVFKGRFWERGGVPVGLCVGLYGCYVLTNFCIRV